MSNEAFKRDFSKLLAKAGAKVELVVRKTALELQSEMVARSPVGNPSLWESNAAVMSARTAYAAEAVAYNEANPGKRRKGTSKGTLNKKFKLPVGAGYVGGRFKNNWTCGIGSINGSTGAEPDKSGGGSMGATKAALETWKPGMTIFLCNSMSYSKKLEYGHSKQAPGGVVRLTVQNYREALARAIASTK